MAWNFVTDFGDSAAMLPAAALLLVWLLGQGHLRAAMVWGTLFGVQAVIVAATKIAFRGWGFGIEALDFTGISGHSALACSVIPIGLFVAAQRAGTGLRMAAVAFGFAFSMLVGGSRVALAQHSWSEVVAGCMLGSAVALAFMLFSRERGAGRLPAPLLAGVLAAFVLLMHGARAPSDRLITRIALHLSGHAYPYTRWDLHEGAEWRGAGVASDERSDMRLTGSVQPEDAIILADGRFGTRMMHDGAAA